MLKNRNLIVRADASTQTGTGHVMRCIALAQAWRDFGCKVTFLSKCESEPLLQWIIEENFDYIAIEKPCPDSSDLEITLQVLGEMQSVAIPWLVLDGYHFTPDYQKAIHESGFKLLVIDDYNHLPLYHTDILLNQNINADKLNYSCANETVKLLGSKYALLRNDFLHYHHLKRDIPDKAHNILVTLGGADPQNVTLKVIKALNLLNGFRLEANIVVGPANPNIGSLKRELSESTFTYNLLNNSKDMPDLMLHADIAVSAGGSTCWELLFMGVPLLIIILSRNQEDIANGLKEAETIINCGWFHELSEKKLAQQLRELIADRKMRKGLSKKGRRICDGLGVTRVINQMVSVQ